MSKSLPKNQTQGTCPILNESHNHERVRWAYKRETSWTTDQRVGVGSPLGEPRPCASSTRNQARVSRRKSSLQSDTGVYAHEHSRPAPTSHRRQLACVGSEQIIGLPLWHSAATYLTALKGIRYYNFPPLCNRTVRCYALAGRNTVESRA